MDLDFVIEVQLVVNDIIFAVFATENTNTCVYGWGNIYDDYDALIMIIQSLIHALISQFNTM